MPLYRRRPDKRHPAARREREWQVLTVALRREARSGLRATRGNGKPISRDTLRRCTRIGRDRASGFAVIPAQAAIGAVRSLFAPYRRISPISHCDISPRYWFTQRPLLPSNQEAPT
jgi:hypothetical protein